MKARVKATGEIVEVYSCGERYLECSNMNKSWWEEDLDFDIEGKFAENCLNGIKQDIVHDPDYWTRFEHQAAIAAMQGIVSSYEAMREISKERDIPQYVANMAFGLAHTLVEKMKNKEE